MFKKFVACLLIIAPLVGCNSVSDKKDVLPPTPTPTPIPKVVGAVSRTVMVDENGAQNYPSDGFTMIKLNGQPLTSWTNCVVTNTLVSSNWSIWVATTNVNMGGFEVTNAANVAAGFATITTGAFTSVSIGEQAVTNWNEVGTYVTPTNWANFPAVTNINANGMTVTNVLKIRGVGNVLQIGD